MVANLDMTTGQAAIAYAGQTPWHRLGTKFDELMTSAQALEAAQLNFTVAKYPLTTTIDGTTHMVPDQFATVRTDHNKVLGVVGNYYKPIQNAEAFDFMDTLVQDGQVKYEVAGALSGGKIIWMLAKLPTKTVVSHDDVSDHYLLLSNGHDGHNPCQVGFTTVRVVCSNTLSLAIGRGLKHNIKIRHTGSISDKLAEAQNVLGLAQKSFEDFTAKARALSFKEVTQQAIDKFIMAVMGVDDLPKATKQKRDAFEAIKDLSQYGAGADLPGVRGTMWGAFNAVTEYVDHSRPQQIGNRNEREITESRIDSITWGGGAAMKERAWEVALATL